MQQFRHIRRRQQIVGVLVKNGFGYMIQRLGLDNLTPLSNRPTLINIQREPDRLLAVKLRQAFIELGPTFIKLGQVLSTRTDLLPPVYIEQLELLQDKVPAIRYEQVVKQLVHELGHPDEIFAKFNPEPLAAASIGQVHMARLKSGDLVIVKIQRPGIEKIVQNDLEIILALARLAERRSLEARRIGLVAMIEEFARMFLRELDYAREARNTERVYNNFAGDRRVVIPRVYWEYTTEKVLTEEHLSGVKLSDLDEIEKRGWNRRKISQLGTEAFLSQIMLHGFFQADPHPGNI
ncbi:MAG: AarF/UbiB family protein, partial [Syntrophomonas sp.]